MTCPIRCVGIIHSAALSRDRHDALFRRVLGNPDAAASPLRAVLPKELVDLMNWDTLERVLDSFVPADLQDRLVIQSSASLSSRGT